MSIVREPEGDAMQVGDVRRLSRPALKKAPGVAQAGREAGDKGDARNRDWQIQSTDGYLSCTAY